MDTLVGPDSTLPGGTAWTIEGGKDAGRIIEVNDRGQVFATGLTGFFAERRFFLVDIPADEVMVKGDVNNDGIVNFLDITPFINAQSAEGDEEVFLLLTPDGCFLCADINMDGVVDFLDITPYINLIDQVGAAAVPEPTAMAVLAIVMLRPRRRPKR